MKKKIGILGSGVLAKSFGKLFHEAQGYCVDVLVARNIEKAQSSISFIGEGFASESLVDLSDSDIILIAVSDSAIEESAISLKSKIPNLSAELVFHCSGAYDSSLLSVLKSNTTNIGSLHPLNSFVAPLETLGAFEGINCALEGCPSSVESMRIIVEDLGGSSFVLTAKEKPVYHAAAVFASNYLVSTLSAASELFSEIGLEDKFGLLRQLSLNSLENVFERGAQNALTGPIERGDVKLVSSQLRALENYPELQSLYCELGRQTLKIANSRGKLEVVDIKALESLFGSFRQ